MPDHFGDDYRRRVERRLAALRAAHRDRGRDVLRAMRRAAASTSPRRIPPRRIPALTIGAVAVVVLVALYVAERAS